MKRTVIAAVLLLLTAPLLNADVSLTDRSSTLRFLSDTTILRPAKNRLTPDQRAAIRAANDAKREAKRQRHHGGLQTGTSSLRPQANATGSIPLIDAGGLKYFINTNITFSTTSSASGGASEASYQTAIVASTVGGGTTMSTLNDMYDGYNTLCVSLTNATTQCGTGNANFAIYNKNGAATFDATVPAGPACTNRQVVFNPQTIGPLSVSRKVFVPTNDRFIRWTNYFTNTSGAPVTFTMMTSNNLGSDNNTIIVNSSNGDAVAQTTDTWVTTFQNFTGINTTTSDPRIGHVIQGVGAPTPVSFITFANGSDRPFWGYSITLAPGETKIIMNFATGQGTKAAANAQSAAIALLPATTTQCLSVTELNEIVNFAVAADLSITKTSTPAGSVNAGQPFSYTLAVTNSGPSPASNVSVSDTLPAGVVFGSVTGTGWICNQVAGTVTCTMASLAVGAANPITINATAPNAAATLTNTATVSTTSTDSNAGNNTSTNTLTVVAQAELSITKTTTTATAFGTYPITYTIAVSNGGPTLATNVAVSDTLPAGATFVSASGTGWTCNLVAGTVTCTLPTLAVGAAPPITLVMNAPAVTSAGTLTNTATVSSSATDIVPANNGGTSTVPILPGAAIPTLNVWMLLLLAVALGVVALVRRG